MKIYQHTKWLNAYVQAHTRPPTILIIKVELEEERASNMINIKIQRNLASAMSEMYNINMTTL